MGSSWLLPPDPSPHPHSSMLSQLWGWGRAGRREGGEEGVVVLSLPTALLFSPLEGCDPAPASIYPLHMAIHILPMPPKIPQGCGLGCMEGQGLPGGRACGEGACAEGSRDCPTAGGKLPPLRPLHTLQLPICLRSCLSLPLAGWVGHLTRWNNGGLCFLS